MVAATVFHAHTASAADDTAYDIRPQRDWNSQHLATLQLQPGDFSNSNGVTFGVAAGVVTASVAAGGGGATSVFANSNGVSWGTAGSTVTATVKTDYQTSGAYLTTAALSQDSSKYAGTAGAITGGSITMNTSGVSINLPAYLTTAQPPGAYLTTAALSQDSSKYAGTGTSATNASVTLNTAGIAISVAAPGAAAFKISAGTLSQTLTAVTFADSNGVSWGLNTNSVLTATVKTDYQTSGAYLTTADLSQNSSKYAGINGAITGGSITVNTSGVSVNLPAYLTTAALSQNSSLYAGLGFTSTTTAGTAVKGTQNTSGLSMAFPVFITNALTTAALSGDSSKYAGVNGAITGGSITVNTSGVSVNLPAYLTTAALSQNTSNYAGINSAITGGSMTVNTSGISINIAGAAATNAVGLNTAQTNVTWTVNTSGISLNAGGYAGTNTAITGGSVTLNTSGISINLPAYLTTADLSANSSNYMAHWNLTGNLAGTTSSAQGVDLWLSGGPNITISGSSNSLVISAAAPGGAVTLSSFGNFNVLNNTNTAAPAATKSAAIAFLLPQAISASFIRIPALFSISSITNYASNATITSGGNFLYHTFNAVVYSLGTGANSSMLSSVASGSAGFTMGNSYSFNVINSGWSVTQSVQADVSGSSLTAGSSTQYSQTSASLNWSTGLWTNFSSLRLVDLRFATSLSAGNYWMLVGQSNSTTTSGQVNANITANSLSWAGFYYITQVNAPWNAMGDTGTTGGYLGAGAFVTAGGGTTANFPVSAIFSQTSNLALYFQMLRSA